MARLLTHADGRLRTGRVTLLIFMGLLVAMGVLFKLNKSMDQAVVAVKHVFEPALVQPTAERFDVNNDRDRAKTTEQVPEAENTSIEGRASLNHGGEEAPKPGESPETEVKTAAVKPPPVETEALMSEPGPPHPEGPTASGDRDKAPAGLQKEPARDDHGQAHDPGDTVSPSVLAGAALKKLARIGAEESPEKAKPGSGKIDVSEKLDRLISRPDPAVKTRASSGRQIAATLPEAGHVQADPNRGEVTVDQKEYKALFQSWRVSGNGGEGKEKIPLRVENLRRSYALFQMKVIAVLRGTIFLDLSDGTRLPEASLSEYSSTLFRVDRPWDKWGEALAAAGIRRDEQVEVRYYMYDFIKEAIYARVNQAFSWCKEQGLIEKDVAASSVDVLGRAYVINRQGGGRFGVFVPVSLDTLDGRSVAIDPVCFRGQADVEALQDAGVL